MYAAAIPSSRTIKREEIEKWHVGDMRALLSLFSGVEFPIDPITRRNYVTLRRATNSFISQDEGKPLVVIDDVPFTNYDILDFPINDVEGIFILKGTDAAIFGSKAGNGVIVITTRRGEFIHESSRRRKD